MNAAAARGSCLCGAIRFRASLPSKWIAQCHCSTCRRAHGAPFATWVGFPSEQFTFEAGSIEPTWFESSPGARRDFCPRCGTPFIFESIRWPGETHVARALFTDLLDREPGAHVFYESHVARLTVNDDLPKKVSQSGLASAPPAPPTSGSTDADPNEA